MMEDLMKNIQLEFDDAQVAKIEPSFSYKKTEGYEQGHSCVNLWSGRMEMYTLTPDIYYAEILIVMV
jgi:hypothetical protein